MTTIIGSIRLKGDTLWLCTLREGRKLKETKQTNKKSICAAEKQTKQIAYRK